MPSLGLHKQLMVVFISESLNLVLDGRAIARPTTLDAPGEHRRAREARAEHVVRL